MPDSDNSLEAAFAKFGLSRGFPARLKLTPTDLTHANFYFSIAGEDSALWHLFKDRIQSGGTYVDAGCATPVSISNTYLFYAAGWRGVGIDANPRLAEKWKLVRPEDKFVSAVIGTAEGAARWFKNTKNDGASRIAADRPGPDYEDGIDVPYRRLSEILAESGIEKIDFMSMDLEGSELDALQSNDWERWRPGVILIETIGFDFLDPYGRAPISFLRDKGYSLSRVVGGNVIMMDVSFRLRATPG